MKSFIITLLSFVFATFATAQSFIATDNNEIKTAKFYFTCNSSTNYSVGSQELADMSNATILSIEGYASMEGNSASNLELSKDRVETVRQLLNAEIGTAYGATEAFGNSRKENRVVIVTYSVTKATNSANNTNVGSINKTANVEGFNCGNRIDPTTYFADTLTETVDTPIIQAPIVLENVSPKLQHDSTSYVVKPIAVDTSFLPVRQAVRYQMREHGMSRSEAIRSIEARKSQWKELKPKTAKARKSNARKVNMKKTRGACRRGLIRWIPTIGC